MLRPRVRFTRYRATGALVGLLALLGVAGCGSSGSSRSSPKGSSSATARPAAVPANRHSTVPRRPPHAATRRATRNAPRASRRASTPPQPPRVQPVALTSRATRLVPAVMWRGQTAISISRSPPGVAMLAINQRLAELRLHSGTIDAGAIGWRWGPAVSASERPRLLAAFNGGFRLNTGAGGFESYGRVGWPLRRGLGSIVTYTNGRTDVGSWDGEVPAERLTVASVRQNLSLLIDHGVAAGDLGCVVCWGATLGGVIAPARSALGITADGTLIWAGGENLTVAGLAAALLSAHVVRAVELDINPEWVAGYLYEHSRAALTPVPVVPGQAGIPGFFLAIWSRDFFTVVAK